MELGEFIKKRRRELNLTQEQLAEQIGKKKDFICAIETGKVKSIKSDNVLPLARILKCSTSVLLFNDKGQIRSIVEEDEKRNEATKNMTPSEKREYLSKIYEERNKEREERNRIFLEQREKDFGAFYEWRNPFGEESDISEALEAAKQNGEKITPEEFADIVELLLEMAPDMDEVDQRAIKRDMEYLRK